MMSRIVGIDLGTTNSLVAIVEGGRPRVIPNQRGARFTPSVVRFFPDGHAVVGEPAQRARMQDPEHTIAGIKRFIGRHYNEIADLADLAPYAVVSGATAEARVNLFGKDLSAEEISALVLGDLKRTAEAYLEEEVTHAVVTIPAYFNDAQRRATGRAVKLAGLQLERFVAEPTAAAMAYGCMNEVDLSLLVLDLGGGTYDVSLLEVGYGVVEVKSIDGDGHLGGDDFDELLLAWAADEIRRQHGFDVLAVSDASQRLREAVVAAKFELSDTETSRLSLPFLFRRGGADVNVELTLCRDDFEALCDELFERLVPPIERALKSAGLAERQVDQVLLVGGATRMPRVAEIVKQFFGKEPSHRVDAEEAVALGAAIQGGIMQGDIKDNLLLDVVPYDISIEGVGGISVKLVEADTSIPHRKSEIFTTLFDDQCSVEVNVLRGAQEWADDNQNLGRLVLDNLPPAPRGVPQIEVTVSIDANQDIEVTAKDLSTGRTAMLNLSFR
jgi:molecular chaperone DnaK